MGNKLNMDLKIKYIVVDEKVFSKTKDDIERVFLCKDGFGCSPSTSGHAIFGTFVFDGEKCRIEGYQIKRLENKA